jgi:hypothetical protein
VPGIESMADMERWIMANDAPLVSEFGRANFRKVRLGSKAHCTEESAAK